MDPVLKSWLNTTVIWEPFTSYSGTGKPTYDPAVELKCFMEGVRRIVRDRRGEEVISNWTLYFDDSRVASMTLQDRITLPSGEQPPIILISPLYDSKGNVDHYEVYL
jgi:hypothetical protein